MLAGPDRAGVLLHDAEHDAAEIVAPPPHHLEREIAGKLEQGSLLVMGAMWRLRR